MIRSVPEQKMMSNAFLTSVPASFETLLKIAVAIAGPPTARKNNGKLQKTRALKVGADSTLLIFSAK
jgi:hypothetical protein